MKTKITVFTLLLLLSYIVFGQTSTSMTIQITLHPIQTLSTQDIKKSSTSFNTPQSTQLQLQENDSPYHQIIEEIENVANDAKKTLANRHAKMITNKKTKYHNNLSAEILDDAKKLYVSNSEIENAKFVYTILPK